MDKDEIQNLNKLKQIHKKQLQRLKEQVSEFGNLYAPTYMLSDIKNREEAIKEIDSQLVELGKSKNSEDNPDYIVKILFSRTGEDTRSTRVRLTEVVQVKELLTA